MKKPILILSLIVCISFTIGSALHPFYKDEEKILMKGFEATGAQLDSIEIHIDLKTPVDIKQIKTALNINKDEASSIQMDHKEISYIGDQKNILYKNQDNLISRVDIILKEKKNTSPYHDIKKKFKKLSSESQVFLMYKGSLDRQITEEEIEDISAKTLQETNTDFIEGGFIQKNFQTTSGYNKAIQNHITTGGNKVNFNIAVKCNAQEGRAYVIVGTPLIYGDY